MVNIAQNNLSIIGLDLKKAGKAARPKSVPVVQHGRIPCAGIDEESLLARSIQKEDMHIQANPKRAEGASSTLRENELYSTDIDFKENFYSKYDYNDIPLCQDRWQKFNYVPSANDIL